MPLLIKRYSNRKLYNPQTRAYVALEELAALIRQGVEIQVVDHDTGKDQTALILSQILLEQEKRHAGTLPLPLLTLLIQAKGDALEFLRHALSRLFNLQQWINEEIAERLERSVRRGDFNPEEGERILSVLSQMEAPGPTGGAALNRWLSRWLERTLAEQGYASRADLERLTAHLDALAQEVERLRQAAPPQN